MLGTLGAVLSKTKVTPVLFPARSLTKNIYTLSVVIAVVLIYGISFNVAPEIFVSLKVID